MNRFLINSSYSQHADTVAQGTNSQNFQIPCATAPQIVANRYTTSRLFMKLLLIALLLLSGCYSNSDRYLKATINGKEWFARQWSFSVTKAVEYQNIFNHDFYGIMASSKNGNGKIALKLNILDYDSCEYLLPISEYNASVIIFDSIDRSRTHYSAFSNSGQICIKKGACATKDSVVEGFFEFNLVNTLNRNDTLMIRDGFFRALKR